MEAIAQLVERQIVALKVSSSRLLSFQKKKNQRRARATGRGKQLVNNSRINLMGVPPLKTINVKTRLSQGVDFNISRCAVAVYRADPQNQ